MPLHIRGSAEPPRTAELPRRSLKRHPTTTTSTESGSSTAESSMQYSRPTFHVNDMETDSSPVLSDSSTLSAETDQYKRSERPVKTLRFKTPTIQFRPRQQDPTSKRKSPEPFQPRSPYAMESDNESPWNSSDGSSSTQITSVLSNDDSGRETASPQRRRQHAHSRPSTSTSAGSSSRRHVEYSDDSSREQGRVLNISVKSKQQHASPSSSARSSPTRQSPPRQSAFISQASSTTDESGYTSDRQALARTRGYDSDTSTMASELETLRHEIKLLRQKDSQSQHELDDMRGRLTELQKDKDDLQRDKDNLQQDKEDIRSEKTKLQLAKGLLELDLEKQTKQLNKVLDESEDMRTKLDKIETEHESTLKKAQQEYTAATQKIQKEHAQTLTKIEVENEVAMNKLKEEHGLMAEDKKTLEEKVKELEESLQQQKDLNDTLTKKCETTEKEKQEAENEKQFLSRFYNPEPGLKDVLAMKEATETSYMTQVTRLNIALDARELRIKNLEDDLSKKTAEALLLSKERDNTKANLKEEEAKVSALKATVASLESDKAELQKKLDAANGDKAGLESANESTKEAHAKELEEKSATIAKLEEENSSLKSDLDKAKQEHASAQEKLDEATAKRDATQAEADSLNTQVEQLKAEQGAAASEISRLKEECSSLRSDNISLRETSDTGNRTAKETSQKLEARIAELQGKAIAYEKLLDKEKKAHEAADNKVAALQQRVTEKKALLNQMRAKDKTKVKTVKVTKTSAR